MADKSEEPGRGENDGMSPVWFAYLQLVSIASALQLANIFKDIIVWKGLVKQALHDWKTFFHPIVEWLFGWIKIAFKIDLTEFTKDYLGIGLIIFASFLRYLLFYFSYPENVRRRKFEPEEDYMRTTGDFVASFLLLLVWTILAWPAVVVFLVLAFFGTQTSNYLSRFFVWVASIFLTGRQEEYRERMAAIAKQNDTAFRNTARLIFLMSVSSFVYLFFLILVNSAISSPG